MVRRMFGLGIWEIAVIAVVALLVLGPEKLPGAAKSLGKALRDFRRAGDDLKREMIGDDLPPPRPTPTFQTQPALGAVAQSPPTQAEATSSDAAAHDTTASATGAEAQPANAARKPPEES